MCWCNLGNKKNIPSSFIAYFYTSINTNKIIMNH